MTLVREDAEGIYVRAGGYGFRPGGIVGHSHVRRMDDGGLKPGDKAKARHLSGSTTGVLTLPDGTKRFWCNQYEHDLAKQYPNRRQESAPDTPWKVDGTIDWAAEQIKKEQTNGT